MWLLEGIFQLILFPFRILWWFICMLAIVAVLVCLL